MSVPLLEVRNIFRQEWNSGNTVYSATPQIHTGWYGERTIGPQITVTNPTETGQRIGVDENGNPITEFYGQVIVNCWAGSVEDLADDGNASTRSPIGLSYSFRDEVGRIIRKFATGTEEDDGSRPLRNLDVIRARLVVDDNREDPVYRFEVTVSYVRRERM